MLDFSVIMVAGLRHSQKGWFNCTLVFISPVSLWEIAIKISLCGVLSPRNEELFDYSANLQAALDYFDMVDWNDLRVCPEITYTIFDVLLE
jgi:hypothetical protein